MANGFICLQSQKSTDPAVLQNKKILADADIDRVAYWAAVTYFPNGVTVPAVLDADGNVVTPASTRPPTGAEAFGALTEFVYADIKTKVEQYYLAQAEAAARASVAPIVLTQG